MNVYEPGSNTTEYKTDLPDKDKFYSSLTLWSAASAVEMTTDFDVSVPPT